MMGRVEKVKFCGGGGRGGERESSSLLASGSGVKLLISSTLSSVLFILVVVSCVESVPTAHFNQGGGGEKEMVLSGRSLYWPSSLDSSMTGNEQYHSSHQKRTAAQPIQLCGYRLLEAVRGLCRGNYVGYNRRSDPDMQDDRMSNDAPAVVETDSRSASSSSHRHRHQQHYNRQHLHRYRRNIIDECCMKPCSVNEMLRYCGR